MSERDHRQLNVAVKAAALWSQKTDGSWRSDDSLHRGISLVSRVAALIKSFEVDLL